MSWNLTYTSSGFFYDPTTKLAWGNGQTVLVDDNTKTRIVDLGPKGKDQPTWKAEPVEDLEKEPEQEQSAGLDLPDIQSEGAAAQ